MDALKLVPLVIPCAVCGEPIAHRETHSHGWLDRALSTIAQRSRERRDRKEEKRRGTENVYPRLVRHLGGGQ